MSGHSKWANIKHRKAAVDAKRGKAFTKLIRELTVAAKHGGGEPESNPRLRTAIAAAKNQNMANDTIDRAIKRGTGGMGGEEYHELSYEGYGPGGVAILVETATDNRNRTAAEVRSIFARSGGQLAGSGSVAWQFEPRGVVSVELGGSDADDIALLAIDAGAVDVDTDADPLEIATEPGDLEAVRTALESAGLKIDAAEIAMQAKAPVEVDVDRARQNLRLIEALEDNDDVQRVTANFELPDEIMAEATAS